MTQNELVELITVVLDGTPSPQQLALLHARLESDPEARRIYEETRAGARALERSGMAEMPADLRGEIRRRVRQEARHARAGRMGWIAALRERPVLGLIPAFATGAAAGVLILSLLQGGGLPGPDGRPPMSGTIGPLPNASTGESLGRLNVGGAEAAAWTDGSLVGVNLDLSSGGGVPIHLAFDPADLRVAMIHWPCGVSGLVQTGAGEVTVTAGDAPCCEVVLKPVQENVDVRGLTLSGDEESMTVTLRPGS